MKKWISIHIEKIITLFGVLKGKKATAVFLGFFKIYVEHQDQVTLFLFIFFRHNQFRT
jgi:hypothetical protein